MKPMTLLLVACAFVAGLSVGVSAPFAKAGKGLASILIDTSPMTVRSTRITVTGDAPRDSFLPADFRWSAHSANPGRMICAPKDQLGRVNNPAIQHL